MTLRSLTDDDIEFLLAGEVPPGHSDSASLAHLVLALRETALVEAPAPSPDVLAWMTGGTPPSPAPGISRSAWRRMTRWLAGLGAGAQISLAATGTAFALTGAGAAGVLPEQVQDPFDRAVGVVLGGQEAGEDRDATGAAGEVSITDVLDEQQAGGAGATNPEPQRVEAQPKLDPDPSPKPGSAKDGKAADGNGGDRKAGSAGGAGTSGGGDDAREEQRDRDREEERRDRDEDRQDDEDDEREEREEPRKSGGKKGSTPQKGAAPESDDEDDEDDADDADDADDEDDEDDESETNAVDDDEDDDD